MLLGEPLSQKKIRTHSFTTEASSAKGTKQSRAPEFWELTHYSISSLSYSQRLLSNGQNVNKWIFIFCEKFQCVDKSIDCYITLHLQCYCAHLRVYIGELQMMFSKSAGFPVNMSYKRSHMFVTDEKFKDRPPAGWRPWDAEITVLPMSEGFVIRETYHISLCQAKNLRIE